MATMEKVPMLAEGHRKLSDQLKQMLLEGKTSMHEIIRVGVKDA